LKIDQIVDKKSENVNNPAIFAVNLCK